MQHLVDRECQSFRDLGVDECELEGQRRKLALSGNEERWIEHLSEWQAWLRMCVYRS